jgi:site-specific DNA recombinase
MPEPESLAQCRRTPSAALCNATWKTAFERARGGRASIGQVDRAKIEAFAAKMTERLASGDLHFGKACLAALIERVDVAADHIRIVGQKSTLNQLVTSGDRGAPGVRSFVRRWRSLGESNPSFQIENLTS